MTISQTQSAPVHAAFARFVPLTLRWSDNDQYGHVNNVAFYSFFDTAVNQVLIEAGLLQPTHSEAIGLVVSTHCEYLAPLSYPGQIEVGLRVAKLGHSSVAYQLGVFPVASKLLAAHGGFTHVYVDAQTRRPIAIPSNVRTFLESLS